jgi:hypothetical protein
MQKSPDLHALTSNALKDIEHAEAAKAARLQRPVQRRPWLKIVGVIAAVLVAVAVSESRIPLYWLGVSDRQQLAEMTAALKAANMAVDQAHSTNGEWPDRVPLPALASLVELQNPGPDYRLLVRTSHWQLTMAPSGDLEKTQP